MVATDTSLYMEVKQHSYRTAIVGDHFLEIPRDLLNDFEEALAKKAGVRADNHTVYEVTYDDGPTGKKTTYIWFYDRKVRFGNRLIEGRY
jgi:hypothetical protein